MRKQHGRADTASAAIIDSQSAKTTETRGERGYDAGKKVKGRKRHILVETLGLLIAVVITAASVQDRDGARLDIRAGISGSTVALLRSHVHLYARTCECPIGTCVPGFGLNGEFSDSQIQNDKSWSGRVLLQEHNIALLQIPMGQAGKTCATCIAWQICATKAAREKFSHSQ